MLLILFFLVLLVILSISLVTSKVKINVKKLKLSNVDENYLVGKLKYEHKIVLEIYIFKYIKIFEKELGNNDTKGLIRMIEPEIEKDKNLNIDIKEIIKLMSLSKVKLENVQLFLDIGLENLNVLIYLFTVISSLIPILIRKHWREVNYRVNPIYNSGNIINFNLRGIVEVKMVHIIYARYISIKEGSRRNGRKYKSASSSNRRSYDYSNE